MDIKLRNFEWKKIENLENGKKYYLQSRIFVKRSEGGNMVYTYDVEFTQSETTPEGNGLITSDVKFTKAVNKDVYVRATEVLTNIHVEEVA